MIPRHTQTQFDHTFIMKRLASLNTTISCQSAISLNGSGQIRNHYSFCMRMSQRRTKPQTRLRLKFLAPFRNICPLGKIRGQAGLLKCKIFPVSSPLFSFHTPQKIGCANTSNNPVISIPPTDLITIVIFALPANLL